jgi:phosphatidylinositol alpha-mannosyltransferase
MATGGAAGVRILQVCPYDLSRPGGVQRHVLDLARALASAGHDVTTVAPKPKAQVLLDAEGGSIESIALGRSRNWNLHGTAFEVTLADTGELRALERRHRVTPFDVLHVHTLWTPFMAWQVFRRLASRIQRRVATFHDTPPATFSGALTRQAFKALSRLLSYRLDAIIAVSAGPERHLRPRPGCELHRLPPCVDLAPYLALPRLNRKARATLLFIGRLEPRKGVLDLIEAFIRLHPRIEGLRLVICGDGPQRDAARAKVKAAGLEGHVYFCGSLDELGKRQLYLEADLLCAPSLYGESYGLVLAEGMAAGLPVVAAANDGYRGVLLDEGAVGLTCPGDIDDLAARLERFLSDEPLRERLSSWGRRQALVSDVATRLPDFLAVYSDRSKIPIAQSPGK